ncbi:portal protein [Bosea sp. (in: a-proteobacteria)]|uniref:portal protein n=1 Tax=Bosea sp. (in: a-proteobacteria) TaxID=1871050 RepID=UPI001AD4CB44|nr:portal protein [Bosea sp. (in: a-proteobacteria)]MBN9438249.1 phage tail protein [Bosea sp. (in: a-proteobacteria)]
MADAKQLEKEALQRLADAKRQKSHVDTDLREAYYFTAPRRSRDVTSSSSGADSKPNDAGDLQISLGMEVAQDFATEMLNTFMPETIRWADQKAGVDVDEDAADDLNDRIGGQTKVIFDAIKSSNFYSAAAQSFMPDLATGTSALWIDDLRATEPFMCLPVPLRELEINVGPYGEVDDRFVVRHTRYRHLPALLKGVALPTDIQDKIDKKGGDRCIVTWGWWRLWDRNDDVYWQAIVMVGNRLVDDAVLKGEGACPLLVARFNPDPMFAFGDGPSLQSLPELRMLDEMSALEIEAFDFRVHKPFFYPDDGVINLENGIEPGMGYKARPWTGAGRPFELMDFGDGTNVEEYKIAKVESRIRRLFFVDYPEQAGKTPPTAEQWMDEMQRAKRRIGTPGKIFFKEGPAEVFKRFKHLLEERGTIEPVKINGKTIALTPYDPTEQAQEFQETQIAGRLLQIGQANFPQIMQAVVDPIKTLNNFKRKFRDEIVVVREEKEIAGAINQLAPLLGGGAGGGGMPPTGGAQA